MTRATKRAVILAGGKGTRLLPYTIVLPKPLMPVGDIPILEIVVRQLVHDGFCHITMAVSHQAELIQAFFGDGVRWGCDIDYSIEPQPLGTMGPLRLIKDLPEQFLIMNGDILTDLSYARFFEEHISGGRLFTVAVTDRVQTSEYGVMKTGEDGSVIGFQEKPVSPLTVSMGIYLAHRRVIDLIPDNAPFGFDDLMISMLRRGERIDSVRHIGHWLDIGRSEDYLQAASLFEEHRGVFLRES